ncbi:hypothetical protein NLU13_3905 [Sarocladium strictum]|uniref:Initiation-specific alpha-1,6-mannosyltransferase n=1 Tax=Sarocladium strictum TaxID=5046 RepID=A0AA39GHW9_SARSR|nr:hypothetical protein NLU13_3905 [Sarocladium strictum]
MLNSRRALVAAAFILTVFFLISRSHRQPQPFASPNSSLNTNPTSNHIHDVASPGSGDGTVFKERHALQKPMRDSSKLTTYDRLAYAYPYDVDSKFPAYIWQTWKQKPDAPDFAFKEEEKSWTDQHPGFVHEVITDDVAVTLLTLLYASVPEVLDAYHALPLPVQKADFFRYLILFARGGIYSDIDTFAIRSAVEWLPAEIPRETVGLVIGIEADPDRPDWAQWYSRRIQFCQWTIQSKPGHPVLRDIITRITNATLTLQKSGQLASIGQEGVIELTGPAIWTDVIFDYFNDPRFFKTEASKQPIDYKQFTGMETRKRVGDVAVLPITSFSPGVEQMGSKADDDPMAFVKHYFEGTWKPESLRHIGEKGPEAQPPEEKKVT